MLNLGALAFASPWILAALAALPVLWWLLRITPPAPLIEAFPPLRLLLALRPPEETPARTPWWLIALRLLIAALIIVGLAHPLWNTAGRLVGTGPLLLVVDDGWAAGPHWKRRTDAMVALIDQADRAGRPVRILTTARRDAADRAMLTGLLRPAAARQAVRAMRPRPWPTDRAAATAALAEMAGEGAAHIAWMSDGLWDEHAGRLAERLQAIGGVTVYLDPTAALSHVVRAPLASADGLQAPLLRAVGGAESKLAVRLIDEDGRLLNRAEAVFAAGKTEAVARFRLPPDLRNRAARVEIEGESGAGAVFLIDERWRRRPVGIAAAGTGEGTQPLLSGDYYLRRALAPFSQVETGTVTELIGRKLAVITLADIGKLSEHEETELAAWIDKGGVLVRFAGPRLARGADALIPVRLRGGGRQLGGAMSWTQPARSLPLEETSPFAGLTVPPDVRISRQVLAEPTLDLNDKTWVRLADGTPLVTGARRGDGWLVMFHVTSNTDWSNLPISGLFIEMLQRLISLSHGIAGEDGRAVYPPLGALDGFGVLGRPPPSAVPITGRDFAAARPSPATPPGYYGRGETRRALNLAAAVDRLAPLETLPPGVEEAGYALEAGFDAKPSLLLAALLLLIADIVIGYALRGLLPGLGARRGRGHSAATAAVALLLLAGSLALTQAAFAQAQAVSIPAGTPPEDAYALQATSQTRLAFVVTGEAALDRVSEAGLTGLSEILRTRTAVEPGAPMGVDIERDELAFFPLLYWPVSLAQPRLSARAVEKLNAYLRGGGTILFDTREQAVLTFDPFGTGGAAGAKLRDLLSGLDIPPLIPVPPDHVLTKSFYLMKEFPGRWVGGTVWVERRGGRHNDGVSSIVIGGNDWAGAWAVDKAGAPMLPVAPGGERQRETAFRFGVNWVMYTLTGNYKTDQVHVPAIIERLGQ